MMEEDAVTGVTSNPTIFQKALSRATRTTSRSRSCSARPTTRRRSSSRSRCEDIRDACDVLRPAYDATNGADGYVSMEVDPAIAYDTEKTFDQAQLDRERGRPPEPDGEDPGDGRACRRSRTGSRTGTSINITLIFSLSATRRSSRRTCAGSSGSSRAAATRRRSRRSRRSSSRASTPRPTSDSSGRNDELKGKLAIANAKLAYQHYLEMFKGPRWEYLEGKGATKQRCLWASTSTKNPDYRDVMYVEELIGPDTINTMPLETIEAFQDHGEVRGDTVLEGIDEAEALMAALAEAGVDYTDVVDTLEAEGVQKFADSFAQIVDGIHAKRASLAAA